MQMELLELLGQLASPIEFCWLQHGSSSVSLWLHLESPAIQEEELMRMKMKKELLAVQRSFLQYPYTFLPQAPKMCSLA